MNLLGFAIVDGTGKPSLDSVIFINFFVPLLDRVDPKGFFWRGVRVVEGARLESVYTRKGIEGSNPSLSAE